MVYQGPSRGCERCRNSHTKCDLTRPSCKRCLKLGFTCPGYGHGLDVVLRDQTSATKARYSVPSPQPASVTHAFQVDALGFLHREVVHHPRRDGRVQYDQLAMYRAASSESALAHAVTWFAVLMMGKCGKGVPFALETKLLGRVLTSMQAAVADPNNSLRDETLAAAIILQYGQRHVRSDRRKAIESPTAHQRGTEALVKARGKQNLHNEGASALFRASLNNAVEAALHDTDGRADYEMWQMDGHDMPEHAYRPIERLDFLSLNLIALRTEVRTKEKLATRPAQARLREKLVEYLGRLTLWEIQVPEDWRPQKIDSACHIYGSSDLACLFSRYYLLQLKTVHLIREMNVRAGVPDASSYQFSSALETVQNIVACISFMRDMHSTATVEITPQQVTRPCTTAAFLRDILLKLESDLKLALKTLSVPSSVEASYKQHLQWVEEQQQWITGNLEAEP